MTDFAATPGRSSSLAASAVDGLIRACAIIPYAIVALALRLIVARAYFLDGEAKIDGPKLQHGFAPVLNDPLVLPAQIKVATLETLRTAYANLPLPFEVAAYGFTYAELLLPVLLVVGLATRFAAVALLAMTVLLAVYVSPEAFWSLHLYWSAILLVLIALGPGPVSIDRAIRRLCEK